jgi:hypothetical protein
MMGVIERDERTGCSIAVRNFSDDLVAGGTEDREGDPAEGCQCGGDSAFGLRVHDEPADWVMEGKT